MWKPVMLKMIVNFDEALQGLLYWAKAETGDDGDGEQLWQEHWEEALKVLPN